MTFFICYIRGSSNTTPDGLSRLFQDSSPQERRRNEPTYMPDIDDFILPITTRSHTRASSNTVNEPDTTDNFDASHPSEDTDNDEGMTPLPPDSVSDDASDPPAVVTTERTIDNSNRD